MKVIIVSTLLHQFKMDEVVTEDKSAPLADSPLLKAFKNREGVVQYLEESDYVIIEEEGRLSNA